MTQHRNSNNKDNKKLLDHKNRNIRGRKQERLRKTIVGYIILAVAIIILICSMLWMFQAAQKHGAKAAKANQIQKPEKISVKIKEKEKAKEKVAEDRSGFVVTPGLAVGATEQTQEKVVYLTLDDGPSPNTIPVLDILDKYNVKATFFVTNAMPEYSYLIKEAYDRGHTIGLHTYSHDYASVYASVDAYFSDLDAIGQVVKEQIGYVPCFIRFPGGSSNTVSTKYTQGIMSALAQETVARGYQYYDWNCSSGDGSVRTKEELIGQATSCSDNNIVLLSHDSVAKQTTVEALPTIIEYYQSQGYVFKALNRESYVAHHGINN